MTRIFVYGFSFRRPGSRQRNLGAIRDLVSRVRALGGGNKIPAFRIAPAGTTIEKECPNLATLLCKIDAHKV